MAYTVEWSDKELIEGLVEAKYLKSKCGIPLKTEWIELELSNRGFYFEFSDKELLWLFLLSREFGNNKEISKLKKWINSRGLPALLHEAVQNENQIEFDGYGNMSVSNA